MKTKTPKDAFEVAEKNARPRFSVSDVELKAVSDAYYKALLHNSKYLGRERDFQRGSIAPLVPEFGQFYPKGIFSTIHQGVPGQPEVFGELFIEIQNALDRAYKVGLREGGSLLLQLASGKITLDQLNEASTK